MNRPRGILPFLCLIGLGCVGRSPVAPEVPADGAPRVFAKAQELEKARETKRAMDAYRQVVRLYPDTPEARKAADRLLQAQREAITKAAARKR